MRSAILFGLLLGGTANAADLMQIYRDAQSQDAVFSSARAAHLAGQEKEIQGRSGLLPSVSLSANTTYNDQDTQYRSSTTTLQGGTRRYNSNGYTVSLAQPLYRKQNFAQYQQGRLQTQQAEAIFQAAKQDLILRVAGAYFDVLLAQDNVELATAQKAAIGEQLAQAKRNFEVGTATITDTHEAQARYDLVSAQEIVAQNDLEIKKRALQQIVGAMPDALAPLGKHFSLSLPDPDNIDDWVGRAEQASPQVQIQQANFELASEEIARNRGNEYPTLDAVASYGKSSVGASTFGAGSDTTSKSVGLQLNIPLFQGGNLSSKVREAVANEEKARQDLEAARRKAALDARQAYLGVTSGNAQVNALGQALVSSQSSLDSTKLGQEVGVRTGVDVLNAQQQLYSAKRDLSQARYTYIINLLKLEAAVGQLDETDLARVNTWLGNDGTPQN
ncbi:MAG: TolC family outer membrane protein [Pseudomonadota bacterium]